MAELDPRGIIWGFTRECKFSVQPHPIFPKRDKVKPMFQNMTHCSEVQKKCFFLVTDDYHISHPKPGVPDFPATQSSQDMGDYYL
jgi:hypothetical protein